MYLNRASRLNRLSAKSLFRYLDRTVRRSISLSSPYNIFYRIIEKLTQLIERMSVLPDDQHASAEQLYFAFGSNLHLSQMATRCPESRFIGFAILPSYRFQINQRGFANVVPSPEHQVEGLCYLLSPDDRSSLDRSEGVPTAYQRQTLPIQVYVAPIHLVGRKASEVSRHLYDVRPSTDPKRKDIGVSSHFQPSLRIKR